MPHWRDNSKDDLKNTNAVVTGASAGIGIETVRELASLGATVILGCRNEEKTQKVIDEILEKGKDSINPEQLIFMQLELQSLSSIREFCKNVKAKFSQIHLLINNAGIMLIPKREVTNDGFELTLGVNHIGHFYLTFLLKDVLFSSGDDVRLLNVSSRAHYRGEIHWDDMQLETSYGSMKSYCQSKLANVLFSKEFVRRYGDTSVKAYSIHPGVVKTELARENVYARIVKSLFGWFLLTPVQGAQTTLFCALTKDLINNGAYFENCQEKRPNNFVNEENAKRLWNETCNLLDIEW